MKSLSYKVSVNRLFDTLLDRVEPHVMSILAMNVHRGLMKNILDFDGYLQSTLKEQVMYDYTVTIITAEQTFTYLTEAVSRAKAIAKVRVWYRSEHKPYPAPAKYRARRTPKRLSIYE